MARNRVMAMSKISMAELAFNLVFLLFPVWAVMRFPGWKYDKTWLWALFTVQVVAVFIVGLWRELAALPDGGVAWLTIMILTVICIVVGGQSEGRPR